MRWDQATDALLQHFKTQWEALHPTIPIQFPNAKLIGRDASTESWLRLRFKSSFARRAAVGGPLEILGGEVVVSVFTPLDAGDGTASSFVKDIRSIWHDAKDDGLDGAIHLESPKPLDEGPDPDIPAWDSGVAVPFTIDHTP